MNTYRGTTVLRHRRRPRAALLAIAALVLATGAFFVGQVTATPQLAAAPADLNIPPLFGDQLYEWCVARKAQGTAGLSLSAKAWLNQCIAVSAPIPSPSGTASSPPSSSPSPTPTSPSPTPTTPSPSPTTPSPTPTTPSPTPSPSPTPTGCPLPGTGVPGAADPWGGCWPGPGNTGVPAGTELHACATNITAAGTYDACQFDGDVLVKATGVVITNSLINGRVVSKQGSAANSLILRDSTIACGCPSVGAGTTVGVEDDGFTLVRVDLSGSGHGAAPRDHVTIQDSWIHGLGGNTDDHKDGIYVGDGTDTVIDHNSVECNDGPTAGCSSAIGLMSDFAVINHYVITHNLLNTIGSYCFYGGDNARKPFMAQEITFVGNRFGRSIYAKCGFYGPATDFDPTLPGMQWSDDSFVDGEVVGAPGPDNN